MQRAKIDVWGVGTKLITAYDQPALGAVYKLVSMEDDQGEMQDTIKLSSNAEKVSTPGKKQIWRITRESDGKSEGDYITFDGERPDQCEEIYMFHPVHTFINKNVRDFAAKPLLKEIFVKGQQVYPLPTLEEIKTFAEANLTELWDEYKRNLNPQPYPVDLSQELWNHKMRLISQVRTKVSGMKLD
jgi:nicotinate phosphoribosyltransferase